MKPLVCESVTAGVLAGGLYTLTLSRGVGLPDSAVIMEAMQKSVISAFACNHTLNNLIGWVVCHLLPFGNLAWRCHFVSALYGAAIAALFYALLRRHGATRVLAALCTATLATTHGVWWHATVTENYGLSAVFFLGCLHLIFSVKGVQEFRSSGVQNETTPPTSFLLGLLAGISLLNHLQNGMLIIAAIGTGVRGQGSGVRKPFSLSASQPLVLGVALGVLPYCAIVAYETLRGYYGDSWTGWFIGGGFESVMFNYRAALRALGELLKWQFPVGLLTMVLFGSIASLLRCFRSGNTLHRFCWIVILGNTLFFAGYPTWDQFSFFLVPFVGLSVIASLSLIRRPLIEQRVWLGLLVISLVITPTFYLKAPRYTPGYETRYHLNAMIKDPVRKDSGTIDFFLRTALEALPPNAVWIDDGSSYYQAKWLQEREGVRPDIRLEHIATPLMQNVGTEARTLAARKQWRETDVPWFVVADNAATRPFTGLLRPYGWWLDPFPVSDTLSIFSVTRSTDGILQK